MTSGPAGRARLAGGLRLGVAAVLGLALGAGAALGLQRPPPRSSAEPAAPATASRPADGVASLPTRPATVPADRVLLAWTPLPAMSAARRASGRSRSSGAGGWSSPARPTPTGVRSAGPRGA
jgi:hypothetical protein